MLADEADNPGFLLLLEQVLLNIYLKFEFNLNIQNIRLEQVLLNIYFKFEFNLNILNILLEQVSQSKASQ